MQRRRMSVFNIIQKTTVTKAISKESIVMTSPETIVSAQEVVA